MHFSRLLFFDCSSTQRPTLHTQNMSHEDLEGPITNGSGQRYMRRAAALRFWKMAVFAQADLELWLPPRSVHHQAELESAEETDHE